MPHPCPAVPTSRRPATASPGLQPLSRPALTGHCPSHDAPEHPVQQAQDGHRCSKRGPLGSRGPKPPAARCWRASRRSHPADAAAARRACGVNVPPMRCVLLHVVCQAGPAHAQPMHRCVSVKCRRQHAYMVMRVAWWWDGLACRMLGPLLALTTGMKAVHERCNRRQACAARHRQTPG